MEDTLTISLTPAMLALVPVVATILQVLKKVEVVQKFKEWLPFASIGLSLALCYLTKMPNPMLPSIVIGLVASGGYDLLRSKPGSGTK